MDSGFFQLCLKLIQDTDKWIQKTSIVTSHLGWRWIFWVLLISGGACTVFGLVFLPETFAPTILARKVRHSLRGFDMN